MGLIQDYQTLDFIWIELAFCLSISILILATHLLGQILTKILVFNVVFMWLFFVSHRAEDYNSDTSNYVGYFSNIAEYSVVEMFLIKLEPFHFLLANVASSFTGWQILESLSIFLLLVQLLKDKSLIVVALVLGASLPLMSSSFRFAVGLILCLCFYDLFLRKNKLFWLLAPIGAMGHISMMVAPFLIRLSKISLVVPIMFLFAVSIFPQFADRFFGSGSIGVLSGWVGVKTLSVFFLLYFFLHENISKLNAECNRFSREYVIIMIALFIGANSYFEMANRWMIFVLLVFALKASHLRVISRRNSFANAMAASFFFSILSLPQWLMLVWNGGWLE